MARIFIKPVPGYSFPQNTVQESPPSARPPSDPVFSTSVLSIVRQTRDHDVRLWYHPAPADPGLHLATHPGFSRCQPPPARGPVAPSRPAPNSCTQAITSSPQPAIKNTCVKHRVFPQDFRGTKTTRSLEVRTCNKSGAHDSHHDHTPHRQPACNEWVCDLCQSR